MNIEYLIHAFFFNVKNFDFNFYFYNEAPLKFELAMFLQMSLCLNYKVQVERDISLFGVNKNEYPHKIDIVIFTPACPSINGCYNECYALEVKLPRAKNGKIPLQMYDSIKDIALMEKLKIKTLQLGKCQTVRTYVLTLTDNLNFYNNKSKNNTQTAIIASYFQNGITGTIRKPEKGSTDTVTIKNNYSVTWRPANARGDWKYYCFECM